MPGLKFNSLSPEQPGSPGVRERQLIGRMAMTRAFVTKILSLAAAVTLLTICVLVAVPKNAGGKLGPQPHSAALR
jgi:hypothetical protein